MTLMGGPIDTRRSPTAVNQLAEQRGVEWFRANCLQTVPFPYPGFGRAASIPAICSSPASWR